MQDQARGTVGVPNSDMAPAGGIMRFVISIAGAVLLIFILRKLGIFR